LFLAQCIILAYRKDLYNSSTGIVDYMEVITWKFLSIKEYIDTIDFNNLVENHQIALTNDYHNLLMNLEIYSANGNILSCSYLFMFRRVLLDQTPYLNVCVTIYLSIMSIK